MRALGCLSFVSSGSMRPGQQLTSPPVPSQITPHSPTSPVRRSISAWWIPGLRPRVSNVVEIKPMDNTEFKSGAESIPHLPRMCPRDVHLPVVVPEWGGIIPLELKVRCLGPGEGFEGVLGAENDLYSNRKHIFSTARSPRPPCPEEGEG